MGKSLRRGAKKLYSPALRHFQVIYSRMTSSLFLHGVLLLPGVVLLQIPLLAILLPAQVSASTSPSLPEFLSHIDANALSLAKTIAQKRHDENVRQALQNYNTDAVITDNEKDAAAMSKIQFKEYKIEAPGSIPDFEKELERSVFVTDPPLFSKEECDQVIADAEEFFNGKWEMLPSGQYYISGSWIKDIPKVSAWFNDTVRRRIFPLLKRLYPEFVDQPEDLIVDNSYLFKYTPETGRRTDVHTDSGCLSFTIALNSNDEYKGGGTWFEGLQKKDDSSKVVEMNAGQVTLRPGGVRHAGCAIESGTRYIVGGFCMNRKKVETVRMLLLNNPATTTPAERRACLEAAMALNPNCDTPYNLLANHFEHDEGDTTKAVSVLEYGLQHVHPGSGELAYSLGCLYLDQKEFNKVIELMQVCLAMDEYDIDALATMAQAYSEIGNKDREQECYHRIVTAPAASDKRVSSAYCNLGVLYEGTDSEIPYYQKSLERLPSYFVALHNLGAAWANRKQWQQAVDCYLEAVKCAERDEDQSGALRALYQSATFLLHAGNKRPSSRDETVERLHEIMGKDNYEKLVFILGKR